ncbi:hypothetical protein [Maricaulis sp.]|uniref:hypothetical protein n=1 Tax=Maricaulis sp. TaxID=1486257 RepID=UPI003298A329
MPSPSPVPVLRSVFAAYAFFLVHWRKILIAAIPYTAAYAAQLALMPTTAAGNEPSALGLVASLLSLATVVASVALSAASLRLAVRGEMTGWLGLQLGREELRLFAVYLLTGFLVVIVFILVFLFWGTLFGTVTMGALERAGIDPEASGFDVAGATQYMGTSDWVVVIAAGVAGLAIVTWLSARLVLALPATIATGRIQVMKAWPLSDRNGWRIAAALLLAGLPLTLGELALYEILSTVLGHRLIDVSALIAADLSGTPGLARVREYGLWLGLFAGLNYPVMSGLYAYLYQKRTRTPAA